MSYIMGQATGQIDFSNKLLEAVLGTSVLTVAVSSGGTGYTEGDILTVAGGTSTIDAQVEVISESAGVITGVRMYNAGVYSVAPSSPNSSTGGTGSGASLTITTGDHGWTQDRDQIYDGGSEREVIIHGEGAGSEAIYVGWRTFSDVGGDYYNLELHGMTGYTSALDFDEQPGVSPGFFDKSTAALRAGAYLITTSVAFNYFIKVTSSRVVLTVAVGSRYYHGYVGFGKRFGSTSEYPYPILISGTVEAYNTNSSSALKFSGVTDPIAATTSSGGKGPMFVYGTDGVWYTINNAVGITTKQEKNVVPTGTPYGNNASSGTPEQDRFMSLGLMGFEYFIKSTGSAVSMNLLATEEDDTRVILPCIVVFTTPAAEILMEIDDVFWCHSFGGVTNEDRFIDGNGEAYRVFQNGNRSDNYAFLAVKE